MSKNISCNVDMICEEHEGLSEDMQRRSRNGLA